MIRITKSSINDVIVTLKENSTMSSPIYLFMFTNQQTNVNYYFIAPDVSAYKDRYNKFIVTEKVGADTLNGEVSLGNEGFYDYTVYQTSLTSLSGLTTANDAIQYITKSVEYGLVWVILATETINRYNPTIDSTIVYNG